MILTVFIRVSLLCLSKNCCLTKTFKDLLSKYQSKILINTNQEALCQVTGFMLTLLELEC